MRSELNKETDNLRTIDNKDKKNKDKKISEFEKNLKNKYSKNNENKNKKILSSDEINEKLKKSNKFFK